MASRNNLFRRLSRLRNIDNGEAQPLDGSSAKTVLQIGKWTTDLNQLDALLPILILFEKSPGELRFALGEDLWKKQCSMSRLSNKNIVAYIQWYASIPGYGDPVISLDSYVYLLSYLVRLNQSLIANLGLISRLPLLVNHLELLPWVNDHANTSDPEDVIDCCRLFDATWLVARQLGIPIEPEPVPVMKGKLDLLGRRLALEWYSDEAPDWLKALPDCHVFPGVEARLLKSGLSIAVDSLEMTQRVPADIPPLEGQKYMAWSLTSDTERSTLILVRSGAEPFKVDRHCKAFNKQVECERLRHVESIIADYSNRLLKVEK